MKSVMQHSFAEVTSAKVPRSTFNRSHGYKTTFDADYLIPVFVDEVIPGDTFNLKMTHFARLATLLNVPMDNMFLDSFFFYCPTRLVWNNFKKFHGEEDDPGDSNDFQIPTMDAPTGGHLNGSLSDYLGIPTEHHASNTLTHSSILHRIYNFIWNEHFRDQNLQTKVVVDLDDGPDTTTDYSLLKRGKRHDYFTSCLPWPQKADDGAVSLPLGTQAPVTGIGKVTQNFTTGPTSTVYEGGGNSTTYADYTYIDFAAGNDAKYVVEEDTANSGYPAIYADLSNATAATIDDLILSFQTQALYRRDARAGGS